MNKAEQSAKNRIEKCVREQRRKCIIIAQQLELVANAIYTVKFSHIQHAKRNHMPKWLSKHTHTANPARRYLKTEFYGFCQTVAAIFVQPTPVKRLQFSAIDLTQVQISQHIAYYTEWLSLFTLCRFLYGLPFPIACDSMRQFCHSTLCTLSPHISPINRTKNLFSACRPIAWSVLSSSRMHITSTSNMVGMGLNCVRICTIDTRCWVRTTYADGN